MHELTSAIPSVFNRMRQGSTFLCINRYVDNFGEDADHNIVFHVDYHKAVQRASDILDGYVPWEDTEGLDRIMRRTDCSRKDAIVVIESARRELIESFANTLAGSNPRATSAHSYVEVCDADGRLVRGVKWHENNAELHLWGFALHKFVHVPGQRPKRNQATLTIAKSYLRGMTPVSRFRQFKLVKGNFESISVENMKLTDMDLVSGLAA